MTLRSRGIDISLLRTSVLVILLAAVLVPGRLAADEESESPPEELLGATAPEQVVVVDYEGTLVKIPYIITEEGFAILEGDIILGRASDLLALQSQNQTLQSISEFELFGLFERYAQLWPLGIVKYRISRNVRHPDRVEAAITEWERLTDIRFAKAGDDDFAYVEFVRSSNVRNCSSPIGYTGRREEIFLGDSCTKGNIMHEIGHLLGIAHEHMRSDQENFITVHWQNIRDGYEGQFEPRPWALVDTGSYCYESIMHYPRRIFSRNRRDTITPKKASVTIGQRSYLAECDVEVVRGLYARELKRR